jgi:hypothetical protein
VADALRALLPGWVGTCSSVEREWGLSGHAVAPRVADSAALSHCHGPLTRTLKSGEPLGRPRNETRGSPQARVAAGDSRAKALVIPQLQCESTAASPQAAAAVLRIAITQSPRMGHLCRGEQDWPDS